MKNQDYYQFFIYSDIIFQMKQMKTCFDKVENPIHKRSTSHSRPTFTPY